MPKNPSLIPQPLSAPFLWIVLLPALWEPQAHPCDPLELVPLRSALRGCSLACSLHAPSLGACILPPFALPTPTRDGKVNTRGRRPVCLRTRIPEALAQGDSFPGDSQSLCTFSSHLPRTELLVTPHPCPFLSSSKPAAWNALGVRILGMLTLGSFCR